MRMTVTESALIDICPHFASGSSFCYFSLFDLGNKNRAKNEVVGSAAIECGDD